jgi:hypothetical protein
VGEKIRGHRATCTTVRANHLGLSKATETTRGDLVGHSSGRIPDRRARLADTIMGANREAIRRAGNRALVAAEAALTVVAAEVEVGVTEAGAATDRRADASHLITASRKDIGDIRHGEGICG